MDKRIKRALEMIEKDYSNPRLLSQITKELYLSPSRFKHLFKQETGQTYADHLQKIRMTEARKWLTDLSLSIKQVAAKVGYSYPANFVRAFKRQWGKTPSQYRREIM